MFGFLTRPKIKFWITLFFNEKTKLSLHLTQPPLLLSHSSGLYPPKILSILSLPFTFITVTVFAFLLHKFQNDSRVNPSLLPRSSNLNSYGLLLILYVTVFLLQFQPMFSINNG